MSVDGALFPDRSEHAIGARRRRIRLALTAALLALPSALLTGCATPLQDPPKAAARAGESSFAGNDAATERFLRELDLLADSSFADIDALDQRLGTRLVAAASEDSLTVRRGEQGSLADVAIRTIELRAATDVPSHATLIIDIGAPGLVLREAPWTGAVLNPPHPDAPGSRAYWSFQTGRSTIVLGLASDQMHVSYVSIRQR